MVKGKAYPRYQFINNSDGIIQLFCYTDNRLGLHWTSKHLSGMRDHAKGILISLCKDVEYLDSMVGLKT